MGSEEGKNRTGVSHRPYDEAFKRAAVAQWQSGVPASRVAQGLGITAESLRTWRRQFAGAQAESTPPSRRARRSCRPRCAGYAHSFRASPTSVTF